MTAAPTSRQALHQLRVLELGGLVSSAYATRLLALMGADVIKVEPPEGDPCRSSGPFLDGQARDGDSALFLHLNVNKSSVTLDLRHEAAGALLQQLAATADLIIENLSGNGLVEFGLAPSKLLAENPRLSIVSISPFGRSGPYAGFIDSEIVQQALSGMMAYTGEPGRSPLRLFGPQAHYLAGAHAACVAMAAAMAPTRAGVIEVVTSLCAANILVPGISSWLYNQQFSGRRGHGRGVWAVYPSADGFVSLSVYHTGREWSDFVEMLDEPSFRDPRFTTVEGRHSRLEEIETGVLAWTSARTSAELFELGRRHRIAIGPAAEMADVLTNPQLQSRGFFQELKLRGSEQPYQVTGLPAQGLKRTPSLVAAPALGRDNARVWTTEAGIPSDEYHHYRHIGAI